MLTKTRQVLDLSRVQRTQVTFLTTVDEGEEPRSALCIKLDDWQELGSPDKITITIAPGDQLN